MEKEEKDGTAENDDREEEKDDDKEDGDDEGEDPGEVSEKGGGWMTGEVVYGRDVRGVDGEGDM